LLDGADAPHYFRALLKQLPQLLMSLPHNFLNMSVLNMSAPISGSNSNGARLTFHKSSNNARACVPELRSPPHDTQETVLVFPGSRRKKQNSIRPSCPLDLIR
jgi:hypothetical protein